MGSVILKYPASVTTAACLILLTTLYWTSGTLWPVELPASTYTRSARAITGTALMLICTPSYLLAAMYVTQRRSLDLVEQLRPQLPEARHADEAAASIRSALKTSWLPASVAGLAAGFFNIPPIRVLAASTTPAIDISIAFGQMFLWLLVGLLFGSRVISARSFNRLGKVVQFDLFQLDRVRPLARSGLVDVLTIAGALAFSPLQALDAEFRWYNYGFALMVALPATLTLLLWPLWSIHRRMRGEKSHQLSQINDLIEETRADTSRADIPRLETLLSHRDRLLDQRTWPVSTALVSRVFLYLIIPPLAWVGAALVELLLDRMIG